jgi:hypothetical protein
MGNEGPRRQSWPAQGRAGASSPIHQTLFCRPVNASPVGFCGASQKASSWEARSTNRVAQLGAWIHSLYTRLYIQGRGVVPGFSIIVHLKSIPCEVERWRQRI